MSNLNKYQEIQEFYSKTEFPGRYTADDLSYYDNGIHNVYLQGIDKHLPVTGQVLDIGAGSGLITNLFAKRRPDCVFTSIDISQSILYGRQFSIDNNINNTAWIQENFLEYTTDQQFDTIICQGVLHHIPDWAVAIEKIKSLLKPGGILLLGVYHPWGKFLQKIMAKTYQSSLLECDQFQVPFETSFTQTQITKLLSPLKLLEKFPGNIVTMSTSFIQSGGLVLYTFKG